MTVWYQERKYIDREQSTEFGIIKNSQILEVVRGFVDENEKMVDLTGENCNHIWEEMGKLIELQKIIQI